MVFDDETTEKNTPESSADLPCEEKVPSSLPTPSEPMRKQYRTGTAIAAFVFFLITLTIFAIYEYFTATFLIEPLINSPEDFAEALAAIFGYVFGLVITIIFGVAQIPANIVSIILFKRIKGKSDKKWKNVLFLVCFILSLVMLIVTVLSFLLFFGMSALN